MPWERWVRRAGGSMAALGLLAVVAGALVYLVDSERAVPLAIGGFIVGLVGSMALLVAADRVDPDDPLREERP